VQTPNIDRLAKEGALFKNAFATTPLCSPSRACFLTGQYAHKHGIIDNIDRSPRSHELVTWPRLLHDAGYETAFVGKWHMGVDDRPRPGFDHWVGVKGQGKYLDPDLNVDGSPVAAKGYVTDLFNERAVAFVKRKHEKPFCLFVAHKCVHPDLEQRADGTISDPNAATFGRRSDTRACMLARQSLGGRMPSSRRAASRRSSARSTACRRSAARRRPTTKRSAIGCGC
jgi:N-acetylglucosamine-6-sulfatase